ncbi:TPA: PadR family transcriptional regulator, partial [Klebsiella pneumoniae]
TKGCLIANFATVPIEELRRHGYEMSAGTVYPMLHGLEKKGYLTSRHERTGRRERRVYDITEQGRTALAEALLQKS